MSKSKTVCISIISVCILLSAISGFATKNSYVSLDNPLEAKFYLPKKTVTQKNERGEEEAVNVSVTADDGVYDDVNLKEIYEDLQLYDNVFLVTAKKNTHLYRETVTTVYVDKVIKGDESVLNTDIWVYELSHFYEYKDYFTFFDIEQKNVMRPGSKYLIFVNEVDFVQEVDETLDKRMFTIEAEDEEGLILCPFVTFPLEKITFVSPENVSVYGDVSHMDWFCFTPEQAEVYESLRSSVIEKYLN